MSETNHHRRTILKAGGAVAATTILPTTAYAQGNAGASELKVALIGCGGRGGGAANQTLEVEGTRLVAMPQFGPNRSSATIAPARTCSNPHKRSCIRSTPRYVAAPITMNASSARAPTTRTAASGARRARCAGLPVERSSGPRSWSAGEGSPRAVGRCTGLSSKSRAVEAPGPPEAAGRRRRRGRATERGHGCSIGASPPQPPGGGWGG